MDLIAQVRPAARRYRYDRARPAPYDLDAELGCNALERALREATGVGEGGIPAARLAEVRELRVSGHRLRDLSPLAALTGLEKLWIRSFAAEDLSPLAVLSRLRELTLVDLPAVALEPLARLKRLERLRIENLPVADLRPLARLEQLTDLCLRRTLVADLRPLAALKRLRELELTDGLPLEDLQVLARLPRLRYVNLAGTRVHKPDGLPARLRAVHFDGLGTAPSFHVVEAGRPALEGGRVEEEILRPCRAWLGPACQVRGVLADGACAGLPDNPWRVRAGEPVAGAVARVLAPLRRRAPLFVAGLARRTLALALLQGGDGEPRLAYLYRRDDDGSLGVLLGRAPRDPARAVERGFRLPLALRELYAAHAGLRGAGARLFGPDELVSLTSVCRGRLELFRGRNGGAEPDRFRVLLRDEEGGEVLDLDRLDARGDPLVRRFYRATCEVEGAAAFWDWFEDHAPELLLGAQP